MIKQILRTNKITASLLEAYFVSKKYLKPKGWFISRFLNQPVDKDLIPIPWFTYSSIHFIDQKLKNTAFKVFEYGSGNSTIWFASKVESVISVEHDYEFYLKMRQKFESIHNISYEFKNLEDGYTQRILDNENEFDIIIIDGRERVQCIKNCLKALKEDGIIIFDNSDRVDYEEGNQYLSENKFKKIDFRGFGPISHAEWQTSIYYKKNNCFDI